MHINHIALIWGNLIKIDDNVLELGANPIFRQTPAPLRLEGRRAIKCLAFALGLQCQAFKCKDFFFPHGVCNWACRSQVQMSINGKEVDRVLIGGWVPEFQVHYIANSHQKFKL